MVRFVREEDGPTAVEYAVMLAMILMACIAGIQAFGPATAGSLGDSATKLEAAMDP